VLRGFDGVADVAIVGLPSARNGEEVVAAVVAKPGATVDASALRAYARETLGAYKVPKQVFPLDELPKSLIGKVLRKKVRDGLIESGAKASE
jgi:long-chain acyl-CoA synthetase